MKYKNLEPPYTPSSFGDVLKWAVGDKLAGRRRESPRHFRTPQVAPDLALLQSSIPSVTWVGHATWIARLAGITLYVDPIWSDHISYVVRRNAPPGIALEAAPPPDAVLVTHNHRDHLDQPTIDRIIAMRRSTPAVDPVFIVPRGLGEWFTKRGAQRVVELDWWGEHIIEARGEARGETPGKSPGVTVAFVPSQHWSRRGMLDQNDTLWGGFVMQGGGKSIYHSGDTAYFSGFQEIGRRFPQIDAALLPIGAYDPEWFMRRQHMNPEDALRAFTDLGAKLFCAMHWGTFKLTDEPLDEPPILLEQTREQMHLPRALIWVPAIGESRAL